MPTLIFSAIGLSLLSQWEMSEESWGYWVFARVLSETGEFIIPDRSPIYTVYLTLFRWMGYPASIHTEYVVTTLIVVLALTFLFKRHMSLPVAIIAVLLWIPYLQWAEPPVQKLALACSACALLLRQPGGQTPRLAGSYALLGLAFLLRSSYVVLLLVFLVWDVFQFVRAGRAKGIMSVIRPRAAYWPIGIVVGLFLLFTLVQSAHPWNNAWYASTTWFPVSGKSLADGHFFQDFNTAYILSEYGSFVGKDFYFTNEEVFGGADSLWEAVRANPQFVVQQGGRNLKGIIELAPQVTEIWWFYGWMPRPAGVGSFPFYGIAATILALIFYGAIRASGNDRSTTVFIIGSVLVTSLMITGLPKSRYLVPLIPVLSMSGFWYGSQARRGILAVLRWDSRKLAWFSIIGCGIVSFWLILRLTLGQPGNFAVPAAIIGYLTILSLVLAAKCVSSKAHRRLLAASMWLVVPAALVLFSSGPHGWWQTAQGFLNDTPHPKTRAEVRDSFTTLNGLVSDCNGIMTLEATFAGAFLGMPLDRVYDLLEVPPFGRLDDSPYDGLKPNRINCVLESERMATRVGNSVNIQLRYQNYVKPYITQLQALGATTYEIDGYGRAIILRRSN